MYLCRVASSCTAATLLKGLVSVGDHWLRRLFTASLCRLLTHCLFVHFCVFFLSTVCCIDPEPAAVVSGQAFSAEAAHCPGTTDKLARYQDSHTVLGLVKLEPRTELKPAPPSMCAGC